MAKRDGGKLPTSAYAALKAFQQSRRRQELREQATEVAARSPEDHTWRGRVPRLGFQG